jgi:hypothetical protein
MRQHAAVIFQRREERRFDMEMRIDEARHGEQAVAVDLARTFVRLTGANNAVAADSDVGLRH